MRWCDHFIRRPILAVSLSMLVALLGLQALNKLQVREYPQITSTQITITTGYYGASAQLVQSFITTPLEQAVANANDIDFITSQSLPGLSVITAHMLFNSNADAVLSDILTQVNSVRSALPKEIQDPTLERSSSSPTSVLYLGFNSDTLDSSQITDYIQRVIKPQLLTVDGVSKVNIYGGQPYAMRIWIDPQKLGAFNITATEVTNILRANNCQSASGQFINYFTRYNGTAQTQVRDLEEFKQLVISSKQGAIVRLQDVAEVTLAKNHDNYRVIASGRDAVVVSIDVTPKVNPINTAHKINKLLPTLQHALLPNLSMTVLYDTSTSIDQALKELVKTLLEAAVIVLLAILLYLGSLRAVIIPIITIPFSLLGVLLLMQLCGFSINLLTLLAMILAIGLVVDDAIVVLENIQRHVQSGESPFRAAIIGTREIAFPVITMTITLAAVYAPIAFIGGLTGALFQEFALTLAGSVLVSGIIALTLSPMMCAHILRPASSSGLASKIECKLQQLSQSYVQALQAVMIHRSVVLFFGLLVLLSLPVLFSFIPHELAPAEDKGVVMLMGTAPASANLDFMQQNMQKVDQILVGQPEIAFSQIFSGLPSANQALGIGSMKPWNERKYSQKEVINRITPLLQSIPGVSITAFQIPELPGSSLGLPLQLVITSANSFEQLYSLAEEFLENVRHNSQFIYSQLDLQYDSPEVQMTIDKDKAGAYGITMQDIANTLSTMMSDGYLSHIELGERSYEVIVQVKRKYRMHPQSIKYYFVRAADGQTFPLSSLVSTQIVGKPRSLSHFNQLNAATISVVLAPGTVMGDAISWFKKQAQKNLPQGYFYDFIGESRQFIKEGKSLFIAFVMALAVIYLVLAMQFESLRDSLVILISVPMALSGALVVMAWGGATLNIYSQIGLITLVGLISKHGILICEVAKKIQLTQGLNRAKSVVLAAKLRLRPILMTTTAMVVGLIPLLFSHGAGAQARFSIGIVMITGLFVGTIFTLFMLPTIYSILASKHQPLPTFIEN